MKSEPSWRKPAGMFIILAIVLIWAIVVATASAWIATLPGAAQALLYAIAGIVWIMPLKPLLQWMETGRWRP